MVVVEPRARCLSSGTDTSSLSQVVSGGVRPMLRTINWVQLGLWGAQEAAVLSAVEPRVKPTTG